MYRAAWVVLGCTLFSAPVLGKDNAIKRGPTPSWVTVSEPMPVPESPSGLAFFLRQDNLVHLDADGQQQYVGFRVKILHANALQLGNLSISWNPAHGSPTVHSIKIHRGLEMIDILAKSDFNILRREDQLEQAKLDGNLTAVLTTPDLRIGDELEFSWTLRSRDPSLGSNDSGLLLMSANPLPGRFRLGLSWEDGQKPNTKMTADLLTLATQSERSLELRFDNPKVLSPPKDAPFRYQWQRIVEYSDFADWPSVSRHFAPIYGKAAKIGEKSPLKHEASRIASAHVDPLDRAKAALKLVQQDLRYIYVGLNGGNLTPVSADETWQRRYGDCKGKTVLLLGLLAELGVKAEAVLVNNVDSDDGLDERLPSAGMFDHVLVRAFINGKSYWLDGTLPSVALPSVEPALPYKWVLPISVQGNSLEKMEWRVPERPDEITLFELDARAGFDKPARITRTGIVRGVKGLQQHAQLSGLSQSQLLEGFRQQFTGDTWQSIDDVVLRFDEKSQASILTIVGSGKIEWEDDGDGSKSLSLPGGGFNPPEKRVRAGDQNQNLPFYQKSSFDCDVATVRVPASTQLKQWTYGSTFDAQMFGRNYYRSFELREGAIRMVRGSRVENPEIDAASARSDNARISDFDNSMARVYFDPRQMSPSRASKTKVPATYELDWVSDSSSCLAPTKAR